MLYFANTLGAAFGAGLAGFVALYYLGLTRTIYLAVGLNILVGATVWLNLRRSVGPMARCSASKPRRPKAWQHYLHARGWNPSANSWHAVMLKLASSPMTTCSANIGTVGALARNFCRRCYRLNRRNSVPTIRDDSTDAGCAVR
jgi:hypothetical protein